MLELQQKRVELLLQQLEELPTLPVVASRLLRLTGDDDSCARDVVELVSADPALSARILKMARRADLNAPRDIADVGRAVVLLGFSAVRHAVLAISIFQCFNEDRREGAEGAFNREDFWKHSIAVGAAAELLARTMRKGDGLGAVNPAEAFVSGLLHDLGKIALDVALPKSFNRVVEAAELLRGDIADVERRVIGVDHMVAGKRLAERWELPPGMVEAIWLHGQRPSALPATALNPRLINLVTLADVIARQQHIGFSGNHTFNIPMAELLEGTRLSGEQIEQARAALVGQVEARAEALGLGAADSERLYQEALASANRQLGQVVDRLEENNRRLGVRARLFDALAGFQEELRPDSAPRQVLGAIAQTAIGVLQVGRCCAFSLPPGRSWAETVLEDETGRVLESGLVDFPPRDGTQGDSAPAASSAALQPLDGPVLPAAEELEWLLGSISPRLEHDRRYWIPLRCEGRCIGGVVWGGSAGESRRQGGRTVQARELSAIAAGWGLALRTAQIRDESRLLSEQLAEANHRLHGAQSEITRGRAMIGIGEMAAGAAHEMNNPLAIISGRSQLLASQLDEPKLKHAATQIQDQAHRLSAIITELMDFAKPRPPEISSIDPAELIERAVHDIKLEEECANRAIEVTLGELPPVMADAQQAGAALREILRNALNATEAAGRISLYAAVEPTEGRVVIQVIDNGRGMDEMTVRHAFDPFYSHRSAGRRRGMGLAKALRWIEAGGGTIRLESHPGQGTRVVLLLPVARPVEKSAEKPEAAARKAAQ